MSGSDGPRPPAGWDYVLARCTGALRSCKGSVQDPRDHTQAGIVSTFDTRLELKTGPVDKMWVLCGKRQVGGDGRRAQRPGSDFESHASDCLSDVRRLALLLRACPRMSW